MSKWPAINVWNKYLDVQRWRRMWARPILKAEVKEKEEVEEKKDE